MAKNTSTPPPFEPGDTNARAVRNAPAVPLTPQRDAKARRTTAADAAAEQPAAAADADPPAPAKAPRAAKAAAPAAKTTRAKKLR